MNDRVLIACIGGLGLMLCAWNIATAVADHRWAVTERDGRLEIVSKSTIIRTALYSVAQIVLLAFLVFEPPNRASYEWRALVEARGFLMSLLVFLMSVNDRIARAKFDSEAGHNDRSGRTY